MIYQLPFSLDFVAITGDCMTSDSSINCVMPQNIANMELAIKKVTADTELITAILIYCDSSTNITATLP